MSQKEDPHPQKPCGHFQDFPISPQYQYLPFQCQPCGNARRNRKYSGTGFKTQPIRKFNRRRKFYKTEDQPASPMNTTQFIMNSQGFRENPMFEYLEGNNPKFEANFGSMLGLISEDCFKPRPEERSQEEGNQIEAILRISRQESDPSALMKSIEKLAKIIREKQERIEELERSIKEESQEEGKTHLE